MMRPCVACLAVAVTLGSIAPAIAQTPAGKADTIFTKEQPCTPMERSM